MGFDQVDRMYQSKVKKITDEFLTGDEVMIEVDKFFATSDAKALQPVIHQIYKKEGKILDVVLKHFKLEKVSNGKTGDKAWVRYRRI